MNIEEVKLENCPYCGRPAKLTISKEMSDGSKLHTIQCSYLNCMRMQTSISGWTPGYEDQVNNLVEDWNLICSMIYERRHISE